MIMQADSSEATESQPLFADFELSKEVQLAVQMAGYTQPTEVQAEILPHMLSARDVLAQSQTGSGKTAAFALPILSRLEPKSRGPQVLVLAPTRELATQVAKSFETYGTCMPKLCIAAIYGGAEYGAQLRALKRASVVVGTPGRVIDHIKRGSLDLTNIKCLVLDEADEMLNMGFIEDVEFVLSKTPEEKQVALFSATMPEPIRRIANEYLKDPATIRIKQRTLTAESIKQKCVFVEESNKLELLSRMIESEQTDGVIVFTKTKDSTNRVAERLARIGLRATALNGDLPQARRQNAVNQLKSGHLDILVATDVAARGLDVERVSHVFNYDLPHDSESYVHRIGRTGRAGRSGTAVIFLTARQRGKLSMIERATKQTIEVVPPPSADEINAHRVQQFKKSVEEQFSHPNLEFFKGLVVEMAMESGRGIDEIAAALGALSQKGRSMFVKDLPTQSFSGRSNSRGDRHDTRRSRGDAPRERSGKGRQFAGNPGQGMRRYRIEVGREDGVKPGNIVGAIANEAGISGRDIGPIRIGSKSSTVDLPSQLPDAAITHLASAWVSGKQLRIRPVDSREMGDSAKGRERASHGHKGKTFKGKPKPNRDAVALARGGKPKFKKGAKGKKAAKASR